MTTPRSDANIHQHPVLANALSDASIRAQATPEIPTKVMGRALRVELAGTGATAGIAYLSFTDTDMTRRAFAQTAGFAMRSALPCFLAAPLHIEDAAAAVVHGVERRKARTTAPRWITPALWARGSQHTLDRMMARSPIVHAAIDTAGGDLARG